MPWFARAVAMGQATIVMRPATTNGTPKDGRATRRRANRDRRVNNGGRPSEASLVNMASQTRAVPGGCSTSYPAPVASLHQVVVFNANFWLHGYHDRPAGPRE